MRFGDVSSDGTGARTWVVGTVATAAAAQELSPLQTVELSHKVMTDADATTAAALLHDD